MNQQLRCIKLYTCIKIKYSRVDVDFEIESYYKKWWFYKTYYRELTAWWRVMSGLHAEWKWMNVECECDDVESDSDYPVKISCTAAFPFRFFHHLHFRWSKIAPPQPWAPPPLKNNTLHSLLTPSPFFSFSTLFFLLFIEFYIIVNK